MAIVPWLGTPLTGTQYNDAMQLWGPTSVTTVTIVSGAITLNGAGYYYVDTEGGGASDDLDTVNGLPDGHLCILRAANASRVVTLRHAIGNLRLENGVGFTMNSTGDAIYLRRRDTLVLDEGRHNVPTT